MRVDLDDIAPASATAPATTCWPWTRRLSKLEQDRPDEGRAGEAAILRRADGRRRRPRSLGVSASTADNDWAYARAWLRVELSPDAATPARLTEFVEKIGPMACGDLPADFALVDRRTSNSHQTERVAMASQQLDEERIFNVARKIPDADARAEYLEQVCGDDPALRGRVEALLEAHAEDGFLESPPAEPAATIDQPITERPGAADRPLQAPRADRRRRHGRGLRGRAGASRSAARSR